MIIECPGCKGRYDISGRPPNTRAKCRCGTVFNIPCHKNEAGKLSCPGCGGKVNPQLKTCTYCQAELLLKACPRCFRRIFHGSNHCDGCGAEVTLPAKATAKGEAAPLKCPRCDEHSILDARLVGNLLLDECNHCHGIWLDHVALDSLIKERKEISTQAVLGLGQEISKEVQASKREKMYLRCPECDNMMNRVNFAKRSGILIDVCRGHGTWFDQNELPDVIAFVRGGGLERSAQADLSKLKHEKELSKLRSTPTSSPPITDFSRSTEAELFELFCESIAAIAGYIVSIFPKK